jgi:hypothetical protein
MQMQTVLMNFGDNIRVINDAQNIPHAIDIGKIVELDVHEVHLRMLKAGVADETLIVVDHDMLKYASKRLVTIMECLHGLNGEDYDALLEKFNSINGPNPDNIRPTRDMLCIALRELARQEAAKMIRTSGRPSAPASPPKTFIREQGDEVTRQDQKPDKPKGQSKPKAKIVRERL